MTYYRFDQALAFATPRPTGSWRAGHLPYIHNHVTASEYARLVYAYRVPAFVEITCGVPGLVNVRLHRHWWERIRYSEDAYLSPIRKGIEEKMPAAIRVECSIHPLTRSRFDWVWVFRTLAFVCILACMVLLTLVFVGLYQGWAW